MSVIKIGTSGFSFPDWKGTVYPARLPGKEMLAYYSHELGFETVEINSTYYAIPSPGNVEAMVHKTPENFEFAVKAYKGVTHDPFDNRLETPPSEEETRNHFQKFREALEPMKVSGKLGAVLLQFPVFFYPSSRSREYILQAKEMLGGTPAVIEFRNIAWAKEETFQFLKENNLTYCVVDEPKLPRLMPFINQVTMDLGYLRLHGRNQNWFNAPVAERYNYLYTDEELKEFIPEIRKMSGTANKIYIFFNNCHAGFAVRNAQRIRRMLSLGEGTAADLFQTGTFGAR